MAEGKKTSWVKNTSDINVDKSGSDKKFWVHKVQVKIILITPVMHNY